MFFYEDFTKKIIESGANRFLFSVHADTAKLHDFLVMANGAFKEEIKGIKNVMKYKNEKNIDLRTSTVITKFNYKILPRIMKFLLRFDVNACHTGPVIIDGNAYTNRETVVCKFDEIAPYIHKAIDVVWNEGKEIWLYSMPYCLMQGYERTIAELGKGDSILIGPDFTASIQEHRHKDRVKGKLCRDCKYDGICLGVWKRYVEMFGFDEFKPVKRKKIENMNAQT